MYSGDGENSENIHVEINDQNPTTPAVITLNGNDDSENVPEIQPGPTIPDSGCTEHDRFFHIVFRGCQKVRKRG